MDPAAGDYVLIGQEQQIENLQRSLEVQLSINNDLQQRLRNNKVSEIIIISISF
jgi:hypothetical protein